MLEKPDIPDEHIITRLWDAYAVRASQLEFLPLGADINTAVYRVVADEGTHYFLKLRKGNFDETAVAVPHFLREQGIRQIIDILRTNHHELFTSLNSITRGVFNLILYPFIEGQNGFEVALTDRQWIEFGAALQQVHTVALPPALQGHIPVETYSPQWREMVKTFQAQVETTNYHDPVAAKMAAFMRDKREVISHLVTRAGQLAYEMQSRSLEQVLCHSDIHAGNLLLGTNDALYIVDWDNPILAPKERDLMFIGSGIEGIWNTESENVLFYQGYGPTEIDPVALAYYRYERIVQDIAAFGEEILLSTAGGDDREQGYYYFSSSFLPNQVIDVAVRTDNFR